MSITTIGVCDICGERATIRAAVVRWRPPIMPTFEAVDRCADATGCRARVETRGDEWPVLERDEIDRTPA